VKAIAKHWPWLVLAFVAAYWLYWIEALPTHSATATEENPGI